MGRARERAIHLMVHLRRCGIVVHHAAPLPSPTGGQITVVVFLSPTLGQFDTARGSALRIPQVSRVTFAGFCPALMYVYYDAPPPP